MSENSTSKSEDTYYNKINEVQLIGDSHLNLINKEKFWK